jgi:hypothetical protein
MPEAELLPNYCCTCSRFAVGGRLMRNVALLAIFSWRRSL